MARTKVFISHIKENASIAKAIKAFIDGTFRGTVASFVSSDGDIPPGASWQDRLLTEIRPSDLVVVVCTNASVHRPWVNFEAGGALVRGAQVIPVCWHGCKPALLPPPFGTLQALDLEITADVGYLIREIAHHADISLPEWDHAALVDRLPKRYTEAADLAPSMFLGLDEQPPKGLRLDQEYGVRRRRTLIKPLRKFTITIKADGLATFCVEEEVVYFEHQDSRTLKIFLSCKSGQKFEELAFHIEDAQVTEWTRVTDSVVAVSVYCDKRIPLLRPFRHVYSWVPPMQWGGEFDSISIPIEQPTGEQCVEIASALPVARAIAFKDITIRDGSDREIVEAALAARNYGCPPAEVSDASRISWHMELPEIQAIYRLVLFYAGTAT